MAKSAKTAGKTAPVEAPKPSMSQHLRQYRAGYQPTVGVGNRGSLDNGDNVATALRTLTPKQVAAVAETALGLAKGSLVSKYAHLNPGQMRMNSGNRVRNAVKRGDLTIAAVKAAIKKVG